MPDDPWFGRVSNGAELRVRLFCFPYAGGAAHVFDAWPAQLPRAVGVCPVMLPGRPPRMREAPVGDLDALAEPIAVSIVGHADRPFALFGYSVGGLLAFEVARRLRRCGAAQPAHLFVGACRAPHMPPTEPPASTLSEAAFVERLRVLAGTPDEVFQNPELLDLLLPTLRSDFALSDNYRYASEAPLPCVITAFAGVNDALVTEADVAGWRHHTSAAFHVHRLQGNHFFIQSQAPVMLQVIAAALALHVDRA